jgi:hypothetical protein
MFICPVAFNINELLGNTLKVVFVLKLQLEQVSLPIKMQLQIK